MVEQLGDPFVFRIVTCDRDWGDRPALPAVVAGRWSPVGNGEAIYLATEQLCAAGMRRVITSTEHDVLYLNSLFSPRLSIIPLLLGRVGAIPHRPVVLAPRGELHAGALGGGSWGRLLPAPAARRLGSPRYLKKKAYIAVARALGLFRGITWQASNEAEAEEIRHHVGAGARVVVAPDLAARVCVARLNVLELAKAPQSGMDVIFCQNLLIYFRRWRRREILNRLAERLAPGGMLVVGVGEVVGWQHPDLEPVADERVLAFTRKG
jgi:hypothetical protein